MSNSINTNVSALVALQGLNKTNDQLAAVQKRVNTGYKVNDAFDDGAAFAIAQGLRGEMAGNEAVSSQLGAATGLLQVANQGATAVSDTMIKVQGVLLKLADENLSADSRTSYNADYAALKTEIQGYIDNATFNGQNLLDNTTAVKVISNTAGDQISLTAHDLDTDVASKLVAVATAAAAKTLLTGDFVTAQASVGAALSSIGSDNRRVENQVKFLSTIHDATEVGLGALVDADLAKESAKLQSMQIRQQLSTQTLSIANQAPQVILTLFR